MFKRILLPLDGSGLAECVLPHVLTFAGAFDSEVELVHVMEQESEPPERERVDPLSWHLRKAEAETYLEEVRSHLTAAGVRVRATLLQGEPAERLVEFARGKGIDLIITSSHGHGGLSGWNVGSVVQKILYRIKTSVMIVHAYELPVGGDEPPVYRRILAPLDGSKRAESVLPFFDALAAGGEQPEVTLVSVVVRPEMPRRAPPTPEDAALADRVVERNREEAERYLEGVRARLNCETQTQLRVSEDLIAELHDLADNSAFDLVVLSAHGYSGDSGRPFGSVVTSFIAYSSKPLLIVQDFSPEEIKGTPAEEMAEQIGKSDSGEGGRTILHAG